MIDPYPELPAPDLPDLELRFTADLDGVDLRRILSHPKVWPWFPFSEGKELEEGASLWMSFCRYRLGLTALWNNRVVGMGVLFPLPYKKIAHQTSFYLVVDPEWQRRGIGTTLLRNLMHLAVQRFRLEFIHADAYQGCPILPLLERAGFVACLIQDDYIEAMTSAPLLRTPGSAQETSGFVDAENQDAKDSHAMRRLGRCLMQRRLIQISDSGGADG